jgi:hypothetical protein
MSLRLPRIARTSFARQVVAAVVGLCLVRADADAATAPAPAEPVASPPVAAATGLGVPPSVPPQGLYEGCPPSAGDACAARLAAIAAAGFRYVLNYSAWYGSPAEALRYADTAAMVGLRLIWPLNHPAWRDIGTLPATYSSFAEGGSELSNWEFASQAVGLVASHPATWGFYIGDEAPRWEADRVAALSAAVRRLAPDKPQLYIARPGAARLAPFAPLVDVAGVDTYPIGSSDPPVGRAARTARAVTAEAGVGTAVVLQAFAWSQYRPDAPASLYPGEEHLRAMRDAAIRYARPSLILWYSYQDILRSDHPRWRWAEFVRGVFSPPD